MLPMRTLDIAPLDQSSRILLITYTRNTLIYLLLLVAKLGRDASVL